MDTEQEPDAAGKANCDVSIQSGADQRRERAAAQLRANLARRKSQARARRAGQEDDRQDPSRNEDMPTLMEEIDPV